MQKQDCITTISSLILAIDKQISRQLAVIMNHKKFKELEANWRSLLQLVTTEYSKVRVKLRLLDMSWYDISRDLNLSYDIKCSSLYYKIYSKELNTAGGLPFGVLVIAHHLTFDNNSLDNDLGNDFDDIYTAQLLGELGDVCFCQILVGIDEYFFGDMPDVIMQNMDKLHRIVESDDFIPWQNLRNNASSRYLNIVLPNYLLRQAYQDYACGFVYNEVEFAPHDSNDTLGLWGNSVFLLAMNVMREFSRISWFGFLRAYDENGEHGAIVQLPNEMPVIPKMSLAIENDNDLAELGLTALTNVYLTDYYGFHSNSSVKAYHNDREKMINMMQTNLMSCRFSHYIKVLLRDKIGNYDTPEECKAFLSAWISQYVMNSSFQDESVIAHYPLKSYDIKVRARPDDATIYDCDVTIEPQYQYDLSTVSILLTTSVRNIKTVKSSATEAEA